MESDYRAIIRVPKLKAKAQYDWRFFSALPELQARYSAEVHNHFQILENISDIYEKIVEANKVAAALYVPKREKTKHQTRFKHPDVMAARAAVEEACHKLN